MPVDPRKPQNFRSLLNRLDRRVRKLEHRRDVTVGGWRIGEVDGELVATHRDGRVRRLTGDDVYPDRDTPGGR